MRRVASDMALIWSPHYSQQIIQQLDQYRWRAGLELLMNTGLI